MKQTCKEFTWLLAFSQETPKYIIKRYENIRNVQIIYEYPVEWLRKHNKSEWLLTTRFDNDDILLPEFVEKVQDHVINWSKDGVLYTEIIDVMGVQWNMINNTWHNPWRSAFNSPALSLFENTKESHPFYQNGYGEIPAMAKTAMYCAHSYMTNYFPAVRINERLYIMCIHDRNCGNEIAGCELEDANYFKTNYKL